MRIELDRFTCSTTNRCASVDIRFTRHPPYRTSDRIFSRLGNNGELICSSNKKKSYAGSMPRPRRRSTPSSDRDDSSTERTTEFRVHIADLGPDVDEENIRKVFQRFGTLLDVWIATASSFAFVVYKQKEEAQKAIDQMDGRYDHSEGRQPLEYVCWIEVVRKRAD